MQTGREDREKRIRAIRSQVQRLMRRHAHQRTVYKYLDKFFLYAIVAGFSAAFTGYWLDVSIVLPIATAIMVIAATAGIFIDPYRRGRAHETWSLWYKQFAVEIETSDEITGGGGVDAWCARLDQGQSAFWSSRNARSGVGSRQHVPTP